MAKAKQQFRSYERQVDEPAAITPVEYHRQFEGRGVGPKNLEGLRSRARPAIVLKCIIPQGVVVSKKTATGYLWADKECLADIFFRRPRPR
jgi:hypothetical protein